MRNKLRPGTFGTFLLHAFFKLCRPSLASLLEERWKSTIDDLQQTPTNPGKWWLIRFRGSTATTELSSTAPCESPPYRWVLACSSRPVRKYRRKATAIPRTRFADRDIPTGAVRFQIRADNRRRRAAEPPIDSRARLTKYLRISLNSLLTLCTSFTSKGWGGIG